jgi:hypothetical protein
LVANCEFASETDAARLRYILKVRTARAGGCWWVECAYCETGWQVPYYAWRASGDGEGSR